ncbi:MAG: FecCD family ABC transporter permease [Janthinobacterium lividum]
MSPSDGCRTEAVEATGLGARWFGRRGSLRRAISVWAGLAGLACVIFLLSLALGSVPIRPSAVLSALLHPAASSDWSAQIVRTLRLPRAVVAFSCGGLLALSGALLQVLLRNPLADPYVLGVSGGAAGFALTAILLAWPAWSVDASAFGGALVAIALVSLIGRADLRAGGGDASPRLLLGGVVLSSGWAALITLLLALVPDGTLRSMVFWLAGDLGGASHPLLPTLALGAALLAILPDAPRLNAALRGNRLGFSVGVAIAPLRLRVYLIASFATAAAVSSAGTVGFVGLIVPHLLRYLFGNDQRMLLPACVLGGGAAVMGADLLARTVVAPAQLPVGAVTALVGVPLFLWILARRSHGRG